MAMTRRKQDDRNLETFRELIAAGENRYCFDCGTRGPTYVNTTIGSFVCSKCSGMLRGLTPPHRVKSISMATFTSDEMELIKSRGNDHCRRVWLGLYENESAGAKDEQAVRDFMADKYEKKRYYLDPEAALRNGVAKPKQKTVAASPTTALVSISPQPPSVLQRAVNALIPPVNANFVPRPVNSMAQPTVNANVASISQVPEFAVDFSTANIYNSNEQKNNNNNSDNKNNNITSKLNNGLAFDAFNNAPAPPANDRYAALADLDIELRQQKCFNSTENSSALSRNPFQSTSSDLFGNKNPFSNGEAWNSQPAPRPFNPFTPSVNMNGIGNSKNPFL